MMRRRALFGLLAAACGALSVSACVSVFPADTAPMQRYRLSAPVDPAPTAPVVDWQLLVEPPTAARALNTSRIALTRSSHMYEYFAQAEWVERAPALVQSLLVQGFENSGKIVAVSRRAVGVRGDLALNSELRAFEADYDNGRPVAKVRLYLKLVKQPSGQIIAAKLVEASAVAERDSLRSVAAAFDQASQEATSEAIKWTLVEGDNARNGVTSAPSGSERAPTEEPAAAEPVGGV